MRPFLILCCLVAAGCGANVVAPGVPVGEPFTLGVGDAAAISGTSIVIEFTGVSGDSRCPADAFCIQGGDAIVHIRVTGTGMSTYELHTGDLSRASVIHGSHRITLTELQPYPFSSRTIRPDEYQATLTVTRL